MSDQRHQLLQAYKESKDSSKENALTLLDKHPVGLQEAAEIIHYTQKHDDHCALVKAMLPHFSSSMHRGLVLAMSFHSAPASWRNRSTRHGLSLHHPHWVADLLTPNEDGFSAWERLLAHSHKTQIGDRAIHHFLAWIARHTKTIVDKEMLSSPHPGFTTHTNAQVLVWLWALVRLVPCRLPYWAHLTQNMKDFNFALPVGAPLPLGSLVLAALDINSDLPPTSFPLPILPLPFFEDMSRAASAEDGEVEFEEEDEEEEEEEHA